MSNAREVIAAKLPTAHKDAWADEIIAALTAAGYRIIGPDELDDPQEQRAMDEILRRQAERDIPFAPQRTSLKGGRS